MTRVLMVRHGESTWNVERRLQGQSMAPGLTERGFAQAREAAAAVAALVGDDDVLVVSSDQNRALQTAVEVAAALGAEITTDARLREQDLGELTGRLIDELEPQPVPEGSHISEISWAGGETIRQVHARCRGLLDDLADSPATPGTVVLVSHGDTLRVMLAVLDGLGHRDVEWRPIANGEVLERAWPMTRP